MPGYDHMHVSPENRDVASPRRHERFYFTDGNVIFQVQNVLYCVHRYFFVRDSEMFANVFTLPATPGQPQDGSSDEHPIFLHGEKSADLEAFLSLLYPETFQERRTVEEWTSCLRFARKWQFTVQQQSAMEALHDIASPTDKIVLGRMFEEASGWLVQAFIDMAKRRKPPTMLEGRRLGVDDLVIICHLKFCLQSPGLRLGLPKRGIVDYDDDRVRGFVEAALATPEKILEINSP